MLFKVKTGRWRGAVYGDDPEAEVKEWLVAGGTREEGSRDDFYDALHAEARAARQRYNAEHDKPLTTGTHTAYLRPGPDDHDRYLIEAATRLVRRLNTAVLELVRGSLRDGHEHGWRGIRALARVAETARAEGLLVILDVKRGDVGSTNAAYAAAYLGDGAPIQADAITVHPCLGLTAMGEFAHRAHQSGACLLIVTRSSNPEGRAVQSAMAAPGMTVDQRVLADIAALRDAAARLNAEFRAWLGRAPDEQGTRADEAH